MRPQMKMTVLAAIGLAAGTALMLPATSEAAAIRAGFDAFSLPANDDGSTGAVALPFTVDFFGLDFSSVYINNNGNITFDAPLSTYLPFGLTGTARQIIAPFFADVDTRGTGSGFVTYGTGSIGGRTAFAANWIDVGYYNRGTDALNSFQVVLIDRTDTGAGNFDIEFNYDSIGWISTNTSTTAAVGYSNGTGDPGTFFQFAGSLTPGAFLDGTATSLAAGSNVGVSGRYLFSARNGTISEAPSNVPAPGGLLPALGVVVLLLSRRWR